MNGKEHCQNCETKDRQQFKELLLSIGIKDFKFTKYQFDQIDLLFTTKKGNVCATELKGRGDKFEGHDTYLMEEIKYNGIKRRQQEEHADFGLYVYLFSNKIYIYNVDKIKSKAKVSERLMPANNYSNCKAIRVMYEFDKYLAFAIYEKIDGKWAKVK